MSGGGGYLLVHGGYYLPPRRLEEGRREKEHHVVFLKEKIPTLPKTSTARHIKKQRYTERLIYHFDRKEKNYLHGRIQFIMKPNAYNVHKIDMIYTIYI